MPPPRRTSEAYGFARAALDPLDRLAYALESGADRVGVPTEAINHAVGLPSSAEAMARRQAAYRRLQAQGVGPGFLGAWAGSVAATPYALPALLAGGPPDPEEVRARLHAQEIRARRRAAGAQEAQPPVNIFAGR